MTLYDSEADGLLPGRSATATSARTHALIIGVAQYKHMSGGVGPIDYRFDLPQLTSPKHSALAFADWVVNNLNNPRAPLGSLELLTSPVVDYKVSPGLTRRTDEAVMNNVKDAFKRWLQRLNSNPENVAFFYFCGHGMTRVGPILLLSDFAADPDDPFDTAINFSETYNGMARCAARTQCYFLDCCAQSTAAATSQLTDPGRVLTPGQYGELHTGDAPKFLATAPTRSAYGMTDGVTIFTAELLDCIGRKGTTRQPGGKWVVTIAKLSEALGKARRAISGGDGPQVHGIDGYHYGASILHELPCAPEIEVVLGCRPELANTFAAFEMRVTKPPHQPSYQGRSSNRGPWQLRAKSDHYMAEATFPSKRYCRGETEVWVIPPGPAEETLETPDEQA